MSETLRDVHTQRVTELFVNRAHEIEIFRRLLGSESDQSILLISGQGGVGKTTLLVEMMRIAQAATIPVALADLSVASSPLAVLSEWRAMLPAFSFQQFDLTSKTFDNLLGEATSQAIAETDSPIYPQRASGHTVLSKALAQAEYRLTKAFVEDVNLSINGKPPVLMLDSFELANQSVEKWLTQGLLNWLSSKARLVIAGRVFRREIWIDWSPLVMEIQLEGFNLVAVEHYLTLRGIANPEIARQVFETTSGLPLALALVAENDKLLETDPTRLSITFKDTIREILDRLFESIPENIRKVLEAAAVLGEFNADQLSQVCGRDTTDEFERLMKMSFIESSRNGLMVHDVVRNYILQAMETDSPVHLRELKALARGSRMSPNEAAIIRAISESKSSAISDLAVQLQVLQNEIEKTIQALVVEGLIEQAGISEDGESLYSLTESGSSVLKVNGE